MECKDLKPNIEESFNLGAESSAQIMIDEFNIRCSDLGQFFIQEVSDDNFLGVAGKGLAYIPTGGKSDIRYEIEITVNGSDTPPLIENADIIHEGYEIEIKK